MFTVGRFATVGAWTARNEEPSSSTIWHKWLLFGCDIFPRSKREVNDLIEQVQMLTVTINGMKTCERVVAACCLERLGRRHKSFWSLVLH